MKTLFFVSDTDCQITVNGIFQGVANAGEESQVIIKADWTDIVFASKENKKDRLEYGFFEEELDDGRKINVLLKPVRYRRLTAKYDKIGDYHCGYAPAMKNGKVRCFIDKNG